MAKNETGNKEKQIDELPTDCERKAEKMRNKTNLMQRLTSLSEKYIGAKDLRLRGVITFGEPYSVRSGSGG